MEQYILDEMSGTKRWHRVQRSDSNTDKYTMSIKNALQASTFVVRVSAWDYMTAQFVHQ